VFCGNTLGLGDLHSLVELERFSLYGLVMCNGLRSVLDNFYHGLGRIVFIRNKELVMCCGFLLDGIKWRISG